MAWRRFAPTQPPILLQEDEPVDLDALTHTSGEWLRASGPESDIVISSRIRLARNLAQFPFPSRADDAIRGRNRSRCCASKLVQPRPGPRQLDLRRRQRPGRRSIGSFSSSGNSSAANMPKATARAASASAAKKTSA